MKIEYNRSSKLYELTLSLCDKCFTCLNKRECPLLDELRSHKVLLKKDFTKDRCGMYSYYIDPEMEKTFKGTYFGDGNDKGFNDKYRYI